MKVIWNLWLQMFFTQVIAALVSLFGLIISLKRKNRQFKYFPFYFGLYFLVNILWYISPILPTSFEKITQSMAICLDHFFTFLEFFVFLNYMKSNTQNVFIQKSYKYLLVIFSLVFFYATIHDIILFKQITSETKNSAYTVEAILLIIPGIFFLKKYFQDGSKISFMKDPDFWIITGILFTMICTLPYSFLENYISHQYHNLLPATYSIFYVFYILLFLMIIKGILCKPVKIL